MSLNKKDFKDVCGYIYWIDANHMESKLKFKYSNDILSFCKAVGDSKLYGVSYGVPTLW